MICPVFSRTRFISSKLLMNCLCNKCSATSEKTTFEKHESAKGKLVVLQQTNSIPFIDRRLRGRYPRWMSTRMDQVRDPRSTDHRPGGTVRETVRDRVATASSPAGKSELASIVHTRFDPGRSQLAVETSQSRGQSEAGRVFHINPRCGKASRNPPSLGGPTETGCAV